MVRPHWKFSVQAWRPHFRKPVDLLEGVQRRATTLISTIKDELNENRLRHVNFINFGKKIKR